jgi:hypothetical protein
MRFSIGPAFLCAILAVPVTAAAANAQVDTARLRLAMANPLPLDQLAAMRSPRITRALQSAESLFAFVTSPEQSYLERRAVAAQSAGLVPVEWLPRLVSAMTELRRAQRQPPRNWGLLPSPASSQGSVPWTRDSATSRPRRVLGAVWTPPDRPIAYPLTAEERERAPWPWQVQDALVVVYWRLVRFTLDSGQMDTYRAALMTMPCRTNEEAQSFVMAAARAAPSPETLAALINIVLAEHPNASIQALLQFGSAVRSWRDERAWGIGAAGVLKVLTTVRDESLRRSAAATLRQLREQFPNIAGRRPLPAAVVIELNRLALDSAVGTPWDRLHAYVFAVMEALDDPPFTPDRRMPRDSPEVAARLADFEHWLNAHRRELRNLASEQQPLVDAGARSLTATVCAL